MDVRSMVVTWPEDAPRGAVTRFLAQHHVSKSWFYEIRARARDEDALSALQPRPREPAARHPQAVPLELEELAVRIRKELADDGWDHGPISVRYRLQQLGVAAPACSTLARIFTRHGMVSPQPQKRPKTSYRRFQFAMVHECWQLDAFEWSLADKTIVVIFQLLDDHSRFMIASRVAPGERGEDAIAVVTAGIDRFQVPCLLLTDNGAAFNRDRMGHRTRLVELLTQLGCRPITGRPGHPQTQGKDGRVHQTLQSWLRKRPAARSIDELQALVNEFDEDYNHSRPHQSRQMRTPAAVLATAPIAVPPLPRTPPTKPATQAIAGQRRVGANGKISVKDIAIQLGAEHALSKVTVVLTDATVNVFDHTGHHLRSVVLVPGQTYYSNRRPRGVDANTPNCPH